MRIGIDIKTLNKHQSGIPVYLRNMLDKLQEIDHTNHYILYTPKAVSYQLVNPRWQLCSAPSRMPGTLWMQLHLPRLIKRDMLDIFWSPEQVCPLYKPKGVTYVTTIHDFTFLRFPETVKWSARTILYFTCKRTLVISDRLIAVSDFIKRESTVLLDKYNIDRHKVCTIPNAAPDWRIPSDYAPGQRGDFLLFIGNIEPRKNLPRLISSLEILHQEGFTPALKVVSAATWKNRALYASLKTSPVRSQIEWLGYRSTDEVKQLLLTCKALVFPSLYEGFGLPVVEALALDCLVITSKNSAMEEIAQNAACYADPEKPEEIAAAIRNVYRSDFNRNSFLDHARQVVDKYTWERSARMLMEIFEPVKRQPPGSRATVQIDV